MKNPLLFIVLLSSLGQLANGMQMEIDKEKGQSTHSITIEEKKQAILEIFKSQQKDELGGLFSKLMNIFSDAYFNTSSSIPARIELVEFIKNQSRILTENNALNPEYLTDLLKRSVKKVYKERNGLSDDSVEDIIASIICGANPRATIAIKRDYNELEFPLLNFCIWAIAPQLDAKNYSRLEGENKKMIEGFREIIICVLIFGADTNYTALECDSPLMQAIFLEQPELKILRPLILFGADVNCPSKYGSSLLSRLTASFDNKETLDEETLKMLLGYGCILKPVNNNGSHILTSTTPACLNLLIKYGIDINSQDESGHTPLHYAANFNRADLVEILLQHSADCELVNEYGDKPYDNIKDPQIMEIFKKYGHLQDEDIEMLEKEEFCNSDLDQPDSEKLYLPVDIENAEQMLLLIDNYDDSTLILNYGLRRNELLNLVKKLADKKAAL